MTTEERQQHITALLLSTGWDDEQARAAATEAVESGEPLLERLCFNVLAQHLLAPVHNASWIANRARNPDSEHHDLIKRLLDAGASAEDLAVFARVMQRQYLCDLGCVLDGSGIYGTPKLPVEEFRVFAIDNSDQPTAMIDDLHDALGFQDLATEMKQSREAASAGDSDT